MQDVLATHLGMLRHLMFVHRKMGPEEYPNLHSIDKFQRGCFKSDQVITVATHPHDPRSVIDKFDNLSRMNTMVLRWCFAPCKQLLGGASISPGVICDESSKTNAQYGPHCLATGGVERLLEGSGHSDFWLQHDATCWPLSPTGHEAIQGSDTDRWELEASTTRPDPT